MERRHFIRTAGIIPFMTGSLITNNKLLETDRGFNPGQSLIAKPHKDTQSEKSVRDFFYKPIDAWAADFIPLYDKGEFHLFYLLDWRDPDKHGYGTPWYRISTKDFVSFTEHGEVLPRGSVDEQDLYVFTGSAMKAENKYHIFYTGHNDNLSKKNKPMQGIMHAVSDDLQHWTKLRNETFFAPTDNYEKDDWRDPYVFWNEQSKEYNMLLCARSNKGIPSRRGMTALCVSKDLKKWEVRQPFYAPELFYAHECPDLFRIGEWWYLIFSEYTDLVRTRYRMSRSINGPWKTPARDYFDGHAFYAAKTASDGKNRYLFGWNPTRSDSKDSGSWNWGGNLVVHEIVQEPTGELSVKVPESVSRAFGKKLTHSFASGSGTYKVVNDSVTINSPGTFGVASGGKMPRTCKIETTVSFGKNTRECGIMLRTGDDFVKSYFIRIEPPKNRLSFDMWPKEQIAHMAELDHDITLKENTKIPIQVFVDGTVGVVYVNNTVAMNFRAYDLPEGNWCLYALDGTAEFSNTRISTL